MGRKYYIKKHIFNGAMAAPGFTSDPIDIQALDIAGFTFDWSSGVGFTGTFVIQVCFDDNVTSLSKWFPLETGAIALAGASGQHDVEIIEGRYKWLRCVFTVAGTANVDCWYSGAGKGN